MPSISAIRAAVAELPQGPPTVAALPGGTTGIGSYIAKALATAFAKHGSKLRVYIVGRNASRAEEVISECQMISPGSEWRFVRATDLSLISEVDRCVEEIVKQETEAPFHGGPVRLDLLYMTFATPLMGHKRTTEEGLDAFEATLYYSRIRFITQLAPLLNASPRTSHVISVYAGSMDNGVKAGEEPIGSPSTEESYDFNEIRKYVVFMKTLLFEELAEKYAGRVSFSHIYPGLVDGPGFSELPLWVRIVFTLLKPLAWLYMTSPDDCGMVMAYLATAAFPAKGAAQSGTGVASAPVTKSSLGVPGGGAYSIGQRADPQTEEVMFEKARKADTSQKVWDYTMNTLDRIVEKNASRA